jgi:hypothetical protein
LRRFFFFIFCDRFSGLDSNPYRQGVIHLANNFTCGRNLIMGDIVKYSSPYLFPFVIEYSMIATAVLFAMWRNIGKNPRLDPTQSPEFNLAPRGEILPQG